MCLHPGVVEHVSALAETGEEGCEGVPNLLKSRAGVEALQLPVADAPNLLRLCPGRLSIAQNQRLRLVDCVCQEERIGEFGKDFKFHASVVLVLAQRRRCERVPQQIQPLSAAPLPNRNPGP